MADEWLGVRLEEWQVEALRYMTGYEPDGLWFNQQVGLIVSRQNGKTQLMQAVFLWAVLNGFRCVAAAQNLSESVSTWQEVADLFVPDGAPFHHLLRQRVLRHGEEAFHLTTGGMYRVVATNRRSARGLRKIDVLWVDEARELKSWDAMGAMTPTQAASPNPLLVLTSNAGEADSVVLRQWRDRGRAAAAGNPDPGLGWLEWSAHPGLSMDDPKARRQANPSPRVTDDYLDRQRRMLPPNQYRVEHLCQWVDALGGAIDRDDWTGLTIDKPDQLDKATLRLAFAMDPHGRAAVIVAADKDPDSGLIRVGLVEGWEPAAGEDPVTDRDLAEGVVRAYEQLKPRKIGYNSYSGAAAAHQLARLRMPLVDYKGVKFFGSCAVLADLVATKRIGHDGHDLLTRHIAQAVREDARQAGYWFLSRSKSPGPIVGAEAVAMVAHLASTPTRPRVRPVTAA